MNAIETMPGVAGLPPRTYVDVEDVKILMGCKENKAYSCIRAANKKAKADTGHSFGQGKANKYIFADLFQIPIEDVNGVLAFNISARKDAGREK